MPGHEIIVIGASAGGVEAVRELVASLPSGLPAAIFIVIHIPPHTTSFMPEIINRVQKQHNGRSLRAVHPQNGELIQHGRIYIAPPDYHMLIKPGYISLVQGPHENGTRPAVDPLFRTAAKAYKRRVVGVVLTGMLDDGTAGLIDVKELGGVAVVQDPNDAQYEGMPKSAIQQVDADYILPLSSIAPVLVRLAHEPAIEEGEKLMTDDRELEIEPDIIELDGAALRLSSPGTNTNITCPDCGGVLSQLHERDLLQFRCQIGHAWSVSSLQAEHFKQVEQALWEAIRTLEERAKLMHQMAKNADSKNRSFSAKRYQMLGQEAEQRSDMLRQVLFQGQLPALNSPDGTDQGSNENQTWANFKVVVLIAAAGGLKALSQLLLDLPPNFKAAIIVVQHLDTRPDYDLLTDTLNRSTMFPLVQAQTGELLQLGCVYVAPLNSHLFVTPNGAFCLSQAVFAGLAHPSADLLLQSVAASFKQQAIAVILSGTGNDGKMGIQAIHQMGGKVIAQDESTAEFFALPQAAIATGQVDFVLSIDAIASTLVNLVMAEVTE